MQPLTCRAGVLALLLCLVNCGGGGGGSPPAPPPVVVGPAWSGFARDAQHSALGSSAAQGGVAAQHLNRIAWTSVVDLVPPTANQIHYGAPLVSAHNTVIVPVKTSATGAFKVEARSGYDGSLLWSAASDYVLGPYGGWIPAYGVTLTATSRLYLPGSGGRLFYRDNVDAATGTLQPVFFYGAAAFAAAPGVFDGTVFINTPLTADAKGNVYFGFLVTGANPAGLVSGIARIGADGSGTWIAANVAQAGTVAINSATNAAPALSPDGATLYAAVATAAVDPTTGVPTGYLLALDSGTLALRGFTALIDPWTGQPSWVSDSATASPMVGPDGDVYFGVLESDRMSHNDRGWLLHFDATLGTSKTPGSFGWDNTPSVVPASLVGSYTGTSAYLLLTKYNNYADFPGGDGRNRMAILDPNQTEADPVLPPVTVMKEVITVLGPTPDTANHPGKPGAVKEWCVNTSAIDPVTHAALMNSEDGYLYRWDLSTGTLTESIALDSGYAQAYTPTALGPDGTVFAINAGILHAVRD